MNKEKHFFFYLSVLIIFGIRSQELEISSVTFPPLHELSTISGMTQDHQGNIWMTSEGLLKYDGENFIDYSHISSKKNNINSINLECIYTDRDGIIWIGGVDQGLIRFDPVTETYTNFQHDKDQPGSDASNAIKSIVQDHEGGLWIGTEEGLDYFNTETHQFQNVFRDGPDEEILSKGEVRVLYVDHSGTLWAGVGNPFYFGNLSEGGLFRIDVHSKEVTRYSNSSDPNSLIDNRVTAILEDSKGNFWVGTAEDGLHIMNRETGTFTRYPYDPDHPEQLSRPPVKGFRYGADHIRFIIEDIQGFIWIGTIGNGINRYDPESNTVTHFGTEENGINELPCNHFWSHLQTREGLLWIGGWLFECGDREAGALLKINLSPVGLFQGHLDMRGIQTFSEDNSGNIYMGTVDNFMRVDSLGNEKALHNFNHTNETFLNDIDRDNAGNFWISSNRGLLCYYPETNSLESYFIEDKESPGQVTLITSEFFLPDSLLVSTDAGLYWFLKKKKKFEKIALNAQNSTDQNPVYNNIFIDSQNFIWVTRYEQDLQRLDLSSEKIVNYPVRKDSLDRVSTLYEDEFGQLYIGNAIGGLRKYDRVNDTFTLMRDQTGILNDSTEIFGISGTRDSLLWLSTLNGLMKYDLTSNSAFLLDEIWGITFPNTSSIYKSAKGYFYMGKDGPGYVKFRPEDLEKSAGNIEKPFVSSFKIQDQLIPLQGVANNNPLVFNHDQDNITLNLGYVNYDTGTRSTTFQYKLENYDERWREARKGQEISYYKLSPGSYSFAYKVIDIYGEPLENSLSFKVNPPWWKTWWAYTVYAVLLILLGYRFHLFQKSKTIEKAQKKAREKELQQAQEIKKAYSELKAAQTQLIHSEKMASLGELTAGIAHEIQNPLNFVNNFSEVNTELLDELKEELQKGELKEVTALADDLRQNMVKITHHGKRADGIVKGMLQHSRSSDGKKETTDLNELADEYLRLAYHGLRAKDKSFNAFMETDFDPELPKVDVVPQDIGRVLLNLITNAFYAVRERAQKEPKGYRPTVWVKTGKTADGVEISVRDNGGGIPEDIREKIFQPFFTTKPTGEGTGLGLSMSYDIVTKGHGGGLKLDSTEGEGTKFMIILPE